MSVIHNFPIRIYYEDTDFSGNVYHAAYLQFMERARTEFLRERGVHHTELLEQGLVFAVRDLQISYDRPARIDNLLDIATKVEQFKGARMILSQIVRRGDEILARGSVTVVAISLEGKPLRLPANLAAALTGPQ